MTRSISILLLTLFAAISTGAVSYLHERMEHAGATGPGVSFTVGDDHDQATCILCATLHMPAISTGVVPLLICLGLLIACLSQLTSPLISQHSPLFVDCRGPPAL